MVLSSLAGFEASHPELHGPYSVVKRSQAILAKTYARTLGAQGIRINAIAPGPIETPTLTLPDGTRELSSFQQMKQHKPEFYKALLAQVPLGKTGVPDDIANAVIFLGSHLSGFTSGATLAIDGAMSFAF